MGADLYLYGKPEWFHELEKEHPEVLERLLENRRDVTGGPRTKSPSFFGEFPEAQRADASFNCKLKELNIVDSEVWVVSEYTDMGYFWDHENLMKYSDYEEIKDRMVRDYR